MHRFINILQLFKFRLHAIRCANFLLPFFFFLLAIFYRFLLVLAIGSSIADKITRRRRRGLLNEEKENEDYGTVPRVHAQVCAICWYRFSSPYTSPYVFINLCNVHLEYIFCSTFTECCPPQPSIWSSLEK